MSRFVLTPEAIGDLHQIIEFLASENRSAAQRVRLRLYEVMNNLAQNPGMGHIRTDLADETVRFFRVYSYLIVYRPEAKPLQIIRVLHGARDVESILIGN